MLSFLRTFSTAVVSATLFVPTVQAQTELPCEQKTQPTEPCLISDSPESDTTNMPVYVEADSAEAINGDKAIYKGDVIVTQGHKRISADTLTLYQQENTIVAQGNVTSYDGRIKTISDKATTNLDSDVATLENTRYQLLCEGGRGDAKIIHRSSKNIYQLKDGSITSCPEGDNTWRVKATDIDINQIEDEVTLYNPRVEILNVPVFYLPYLTLPVGDTRKTGFLYPSVSLDTRDGFGLSVPIYWNLAPNYDLQTDINYMEKRGVQLNSKFRYLTAYGGGSIRSEYLHEDKENPEKEERWGINWKHNGVLNAWKFNVDYSQVSDIFYFSDLTSEIGNREEGQLLQSGEASYRSATWDTTLRVRNFQVLSSSTPYRLMPQLEFNYYAPHFYRKLDFNLLSHMSRFETDDVNKPSATRLHIEPTLQLPLSTTWGTFTAETKLYQTYYEQDIDALTRSNDYEEKVSRTIPQLRIHSGLYLERQAPEFGGYLQTLEPQVQYLYIPEKDQSAIYSKYDTSKLQLDYDGLFRSQKYGNIDYIAPANQLSYGASSRFFDDEFKERMNISFGQIFYLNDSYNESSSAEKPSYYSAWALDAEFNYDDFLFYRGGFQFDTASSQVQLADSTFEYRYPAGYSQLNYRYVSLDYITSNVDFIRKDNYTYTREGINQLGFITSYNLNRNWKFNGQYFYDLNENVNLEWLTSVNYTSDCWYIGVSYSNQLYSWKQIGVGEPTYEQNFTVNFGIIGFGQRIAGSSGLVGIESSSSSLGYSRPFYLNN